MNRHFLPIILVLGAACGSHRPGRTLEYYFTADPRSLDPALSTDVPSGEVVTLLFDNLTRFDVDGRLEPDLARSWELDRRGVTYTFHLRPGVRFHDGRPLTARDVAASFRRALAPATSGGRGWPLYPIQGAEAFAAGTAAGISGLRIPDDSTVVLSLARPLNVFPKLLAMPVAAVVPESLPPGDFGQHPIGSGPWRFVSWSHDDQIVVARNPDYWGKPAASDTLRIRIIPEALTQAAEYESGRLSVVEVPFGETARWEHDHAAELDRRPAIRALYVAINTRRGPLADVRVRQALNYATDVSTLLGQIMGGRGTRTAGALPPGLDGYDSTRAPYPHDVAKAKALLRAAGYPNGISLQLWRTDRDEYGRLAQAIQQELAEAGIRVEIVERDASTARAASMHGNADLFLTDWYADYPDAEDFNFPLFHSSNAGAGGNRAFLADSALDRMITRARETPDSAERVGLDRQIDARVFALAPWIFLWAPVDLWARQPYLHGWRIPAIFTGQRWTDAVVSR
ncbi:MAG TPA: ABC transporter substrate-binding protein [Gemmatimonadales bacterium]|nr:ABC transporter substrate-binding protein [Gemmatimonadales bacterium]